MKTAEQLAHEYWERPQWQLSFMPFIEEVQLEAFKAGMEHAADLLTPVFSDPELNKGVLATKANLKEISKNLTQLP
jgi:hypothetical protein